MYILKNSSIARKLSSAFPNYGLFFRALFRWICLKDLNKIEIDDTVSSESPLGILRGIKQGTETYHDLFKRLCR